MTNSPQVTPQASHPDDAADARIDALAAPVRELHARFDTLVLPHRAALWSYARRLTGNGWDAEDLVQETLLRAFATLPRLYQPLDTRAYVFRIATNAWIDRMRHSRATWVGLEEATELAAEEPSWDGADVTAALERVVSLLPPRQRVIVLLVVAFDFTAAEVAAMLGTTTGAVKAALHRARVALAASGSHPGPAERRTEAGGAPPALLARFVEAFNRRDPDAIAALLDEEATNEIVGVAEEQGRRVSRENSLAEWAAAHEAEIAEVDHLDGQPVVVVYEQQGSGVRALSWLIRLSTDDGRIVRQRQYYFCPELIAYAAERFGVPARTHGHRYAGADATGEAVAAGA